MSFDLFVYGTLLPELEGYPLVGPYLLERKEGAVIGQLYAGAYPMLKLGMPGLVHGEWYRLLDEALPLLDGYEDYWGPDHPDNEYDRVWIRDALHAGEGWTYTARCVEGLPLLEHGSWKLYRKQGKNGGPSPCKNSRLFST